MARSRGNKDAGQDAIVAALRAHGATVAITSGVAARVRHLAGFPDLCVGFCGRTTLLEVKEEGEGLTPDEEDWHGAWDGHVAVVRSPAEALAELGIRFV